MVKTLKRTSHLLPWLAALGLLGWLLRLVPVTAVFQTLQQLHWPQLLTLVALNGTALALLTGRWWLILWGLGHRLPFGMAVGHRLAAFGVSYFTPGPHFGGEPVQVLLAEKVHGVPRVTAVAAISLDKSLELLVNFFFLAVGVLVTLHTGLFDATWGGQATVVMAVLLLVPVVYLVSIWRGKRPLTGLMHRAQSVFKRPAWPGWYATAVQGMAASEALAYHFCHQSPRLFTLVLLISLAGWGTMIAEYGLMLSFLGVALSPVHIVVALTAMRLAYLLPLPGGLGTLEASQVFALGLMGVSPALGIGTSLLIRARDVLLAVAGLGWGSRFVRAR